MEVIILLKLEVDKERLKTNNEPDLDIKAKIRAMMADIVGNTLEQHGDDRIKLIGTGLLVIISDKDGTMQLQDSKKVIKKPPLDFKME